MPNPGPPSLTSSSAAELQPYHTGSPAVDDDILLDPAAFIEALRQTISSDESMWDHLVAMYDAHEGLRDAYTGYLIEIAKRTFDEKSWEIAGDTLTCLFKDPDTFATAFAESLIHRVYEDLVRAPLTMICDGLGWMISVSAAIHAANFRDLLPLLEELPPEERQLLEFVIADGQTEIEELVTSLNKLHDFMVDFEAAVAEALDRPVLDVLESGLVISQVGVEVVSTMVASDKLRDIVASTAKSQAAMGALYGNIVGFVVSFMVPGADEVLICATAGRIFKGVKAGGAAADVIDTAIDIVEKPKLPGRTDAPKPLSGIAQAPRIMSAPHIPSAVPTPGTAAFVSAEAARIFREFEPVLEEMIRLCLISATERGQRLLSRSVTRHALRAARNTQLSLTAIENANRVAHKLIYAMRGLEGKYGRITNVTERVNEQIWFLAALNPGDFRNNTHYWRDSTNALRGTRLFQAAHLPIDGRFLELPNHRVAREIRELLAKVYPSVDPASFTPKDMNAIAVLGIEHLSSVNRLLSPRLRSTTETIIMHGTLTNRMNAAIIVEDIARAEIPKGALVVTKTTSLKQVLDAAERVLQADEFKDVYTRVAPVLAMYRGHLGP